MCVTGVVLTGPRPSVAGWEGSNGTAAAAEWIGECATTNCVNATLCLDPFHIVQWATGAPDVVRYESLGVVGFGSTVR